MVDTALRKLLSLHNERIDFGKRAPVFHAGCVLHHAAHNSIFVVRRAGRLVVAGGQRIVPQVNQSEGLPARSAIKVLLDPASMEISL